jgi:hypothetical protein
VYRRPFPGGGCNLRRGRFEINETVRIVMRVTLAVAMTMAMMVLGSGCEPQTKQTRRGYAVVMDSAPVLTDPSVYRWGQPIGEIVASQTAATGATRLDVSFTPDAQPLLTDNAVFYVWAGRLTHERLGAFGSPVQEGARFMGFPSKSQLRWFRFKTMFRRSADVAARRAQTLASAFSDR